MAPNLPFRLPPHIQDPPKSGAGPRSLALPKPNKQLDDPKGSAPSRLSLLVHGTPPPREHRPGNLSEAAEGASGFPPGEVDRKPGHHPHQRHRGHAYDTV